MAEDSPKPDGRQFSQEEKKIDRLLERLYQTDRTGGSLPSRPVSAKWFGEIRALFPPQIVHLLQRDAIDRFGVKKLLSEPSILEQVEPDVGLIASVLAVKEALSNPAIEGAKKLIERLARAVESKLQFKLLNRISGRQSKGIRVIHPRKSDIDWHLTIRNNLRHYQPELGTIIPNKLYGQPRKSRALKHLIILVDQSASMSESVIYAGILAGIMYKVPTLKTHFIVFDTSVVDLTDALVDIVELLFEVQLGGGTDIQQALGYAEELIEPSLDTHILLITDLYEGAPEHLLYQRCQQLMDKGVNLFVLLALDDQGKPSYDAKIGKHLATMGIPSFATTPEAFPEVIASALNGEDLNRFK